MATVQRAQAVLLAICVAAALGAFSYACGPAGFDAQAKLGSVRVLATRTDKPYAKPGEDVTVEVLAVDARKTPKRPMKIYWLPFVCENPFGDLYYACFAPLLGGDGGVADGGRADAGAPIFRPGLDITAFLKEGTKYSFNISPDIIARHKPVAGSVAPYGLAIAFAVACAGQVRTLAIDPNNVNPQKVPIGCFDDDGNQLGADDFVFTFSRVYVYVGQRMSPHRPALQNLRCMSQDPRECPLCCSGRARLTAMPLATGLFPGRLATMGSSGPRRGTMLV